MAIVRKRCVNIDLGVKSYQRKLNEILPFILATKTKGMKPIKTVIVDDDPDCVKLLASKLAKHCQKIKLVGAFTDPQNDYSSIAALAQDVLILDIAMPNMSGFELLEKISPVNPRVIFITGSNKKTYEEKVLRFNTLAFLEKPLDSNRLVEMVVSTQQQLQPSVRAIKLLKKQIETKHINKIAVPDTNGVAIIAFEDILYIEGSNNYCIIHTLKGKQRYTISKTLKDVQDVFEDNEFLRIHKTYVVNTKSISHVNSRNKLIEMDNGDKLPVARNKLKLLLGRYHRL